MSTLFANSGKRIDYKGGEYKIVESGIHEDGTPYVVLEPENEELTERMRAHIRKHRLLTTRLKGRSYFLVLGDNEYPYRR